MKSFKAFMAVFCAAVLMGFFAAPSEAEVKITIKNNRSHTLSIAFCWAGFDTPDFKKKGWYNVKAGETRTITIKEAAYYFNSTSGFGYYAFGGGKVWAGQEGKGAEVIIHPTKSFSGYWDEPISGGKKVWFRHVNLKQTSEDMFHGSATLTFAP